MNDNDETQRAPPADDEQETTSEDCATSADHTQLAWSDDDGTDEPQHRSWWWIAVPILACSAVLAVAIGVSLWVSRLPAAPQPAPKAQRTTGPTVTQTVSAAPAPPTTATVTVAPAPAPSTPALSATDRAFLADVQHYGLYYSDPAYPIAHAHALCNWITAHPNAGAVNYVQASTIWTDDDSATNFIIAVVPHYCPQFNSGIGR
jgi:hypothetical protein